MRASVSRSSCDAPSSNQISFFISGNHASNALACSPELGVRPRARFIPSIIRVRPDGAIGIIYLLDNRNIWGFVAGFKGIKFGIGYFYGNFPIYESMV